MQHLSGLVALLWLLLLPLTQRHHLEALPLPRLCFGEPPLLLLVASWPQLLLLRQGLLAPALLRCALQPRPEPVPVLVPALVLVLRVHVPVLLMLARMQALMLLVVPTTCSAACLHQAAALL